MCRKHLSLLPIILSDLLSKLTSWKEFSIGNHRLSALSLVVSPMKVESLYSVLLETIVLIFSHPISGFTNPEILQNPQVVVLKKNYRQRYSKILKRWNFPPKLQAEILQNFQEIKFRNQDYSQRYCKILRMWNL